MNRNPIDPRSFAPARNDSGPGLGDDVPCEKCGAVALDTGLECNRCGHDNYEAVTGKPFGSKPRTDNTNHSAPAARSNEPTAWLIERDGARGLRWDEPKDEAGKVTALYPGQQADTSGYIEAFYAIAKLLDIPARIESPQWVFENVMLLKLAALKARAQAQEWQPIKTAPEKQRLLVLAGSSLPTVAIKVPANWLEPNDEDIDADWVEYDLATDQVYCPAGWYEKGQEVLAPISEPTRWMPLPKPSLAAAKEQP